MFNWIADSRQRLLNWWIFTYTLAGFFMILWQIYTVIYAFNKFTVTDNSIITIVCGMVGLVTVTCLKTDSIRGWAVSHPWLLALTGSLVDGVTEYFLLVDPIVKFICDAFATHMWFNIWAIQGEERYNAILNKEAKIRVKFHLNQNIGHYLSVIAASLIALFIPNIPIDWVVWMSMGTCCFCYFLTATRFVAADTYMKNHNLKYPYQEEDNEEDEDEE